MLEYNDSTLPSDQEEESRLAWALCSRMVLAELLLVAESRSRTTWPSYSRPSERSLADRLRLHLRPIHHRCRTSTVGRGRFAGSFAVDPATLGPGLSLYWIVHRTLSPYGWKDRGQKSLRVVERR